MKKLLFFTLIILTFLLSACFKKTPERPTSLEQPKPPAPFSRGPTAPPKISAPTYPQP